MEADDNEAQPKSDIRTAIVRVAEATRVSVPTLVGGVVTLMTENPAIGAGAAVVTQRLTSSDVAQRVARHVGERLGLFTDSTQEALPTGFEPSAENPYFDHAVYQNYRHAMDAIDVAVIPALARLTALYCDRPADTFFRGVGRTLEDLTASEFHTCRRLFSGVVKADEDFVRVSPQGHPGEVRVLMATQVREAKSWVIKGLSDETVRCIRVLERNDLTWDANGFYRDRAQALEAVFGAIPVELDDRHGAATAF